MIKQIIPRICSKPRMPFNFLRSIQAKSIHRFPLQSFVYEIGCFKTPAFRDFMSFYLHLLRQDSVSNLLSRFTNVWSFPKHTLISDHSNCKVINSDSMVLATHYFRRHVPRCAGRVFRVIRVPHSGYSKICQSKIPVFLKNQILRFDVSMYDSFIMNVLERDKHASDKELHLLFREATVF